jgi:formylmethanofuran dehydrogenase subunit B
MTAAETRHADIVCPFCSLACDDVAVALGADRQVSLIGPDCPRARILYADAGGPDGIPAAIDGHEVADEEAIARAAALIAASAAPLIAGLGADIDGVRAALRLADRCGAALDHLRAEGQFRLLLPLIERGAVLTTMSEVRNRADCLLVIGPDPRRVAPRLFERALPADALFLPPGAPRHLLFLAGAPEGAVAAHLSVEIIDAPLPRLAEVAGALRRLVVGGALPAREVAGVANERLAGLARRLQQARYGVAMFAPGLIDCPEPDLALAAVLALVQDLNRETRWAALPVAGPDGVTGAFQAMLWQAGLPLRSRFAAAGPVFDPRRFETARLLASGEADLMVWISAFAPEPPPATAIPVIALTHPLTVLQRPPAVMIPIGVPGVDYGGAVFRTDGVVALPLQALRRSSRRSPAAVLNAIADALPETLR